MLNVRRKPNSISPIISVLSEGDTITINLSESTEDFYKVDTDDGNSGYCVKQFVQLLQ